MSVGSVFGGSEMSHDSVNEGSGSGGGSSNGNMGENVDVIRDPKQASNSCLQRDICVPVPVDDHDASIFIFPQCIELPQCLGSCCDSLQRCHPEHVVPVMVEVKKWAYFDNGELRQVGIELVRMAKHMDCGCEKCRDSNLTCGPNHVRKDCACRCDNEREASNCNSPRKWSNDDCRCECAIKKCAAGERLNAQECKCFPSHAGRNVTSAAPTSNNVDLFPKLKANIRTGRPTQRPRRFD